MSSAKRKLSFFYGFAEFISIACALIVFWYLFVRDFKIELSFDFLILAAALFALIISRIASRILQNVIESHEKEDYAEINKDNYESYFVKENIKTFKTDINIVKRSIIMYKVLVAVALAYLAIIAGILVKIDYSEELYSLLAINSFVMIAGGLYFGNRIVSSKEQIKRLDEMLARLI
jgi:hypothetical protein